MAHVRAFVDTTTGVVKHSDAEPVRLTTGAGSGKVLTSDADGVGAWGDAPVIESVIFDGGGPDTDHTLNDSVILNAGGPE